MGSLFSGKQKTSTTQNQSWGPQAYIGDAYKGLVGQAQQTAQTPWNPATRQQVAGFNPTQQRGFSTVRQTVGDYQPYLQDAGALADRGSAATTGADISRYMNPYTDQVIGAAMNDWDLMADRRMADTNSNAAKVGALTGDRSQVAQALAREASDREMSSGIASLRDQGWQSALGAAQTDASRALQGSQIQSGLGQLSQQLGLNDANALLASGTMQQELRQKQLDAKSGNAKAQSAYPFETTQWLGSLLQGIGSQAGGTSEGTGTSTAKNSGGGLGQIVGLGATLFGMSDERVKEDIQPIGETFDGQPIYRYRFAGSPKTEIGLMAQEVEQRHPEAVADIGGLKHVNYHAATEDAARPAYADGGGVGELRNISYVPMSGMRPTGSMSPPQMSVAAPSSSGGSSGGMSDMLESLKMAQSAMGGGGEGGVSNGGIMSQSGGLGAMLRTSTDPSSGWSTTVNPTGSQGWGNFLGNSMSSGLGSLASGIGSVFGFADGGVVEEQPSGLGAVRPTASAAPPAPSPEKYQHILWDNGLGEDASNAIMMAGLGMLAGGGRDAFSDIGRGGMAGINYYNQATRQRRSDAEAKAKEAQGKLMEIGGRVIRMMPDGATSVVYEAPAKHEKTNDIVEYEYAKANGFAGDFNQFMTAKRGGSGEATATDREKLAAQYGLDPNSDAGRAYILTGKLPREDQQMLTATDKKAILEADDKVVSGQDTATYLRKATDKNADAYEGFGSGIRTWLGNNLWDGLVPDKLASPERAAATSMLDNSVISSALSKLKETFGGAPTEGERAILMKVAGASDQPYEVRKQIFDEAARLVERRIEINKREADQLRGGTYYKPGGGMSGTPGAQPAPSGLGGAPVRAKDDKGNVLEFNGKEWVPVQ